LGLGKDVEGQRVSPRGMSKSEARFDAGEAYWRSDARISVGFRSGRDEGVTRGEGARPGERQARS
jgi:hypothetical protein